MHLNMHVEIINFCFHRYCVTELSAVVDKSCCMSWRVGCVTVSSPTEGLLLTVAIEMISSKY